MALLRSMSTAGVATMTPPCRSQAALRRRECLVTWSSVRHAQVGERGVTTVGQSRLVMALEVLGVERLAADLTAPAGELEAPAAVAQVLGRRVVLAVRLRRQALGLDDRRAGRAVAGAGGARATSTAARGAPGPAGVALTAVLARWRAPPRKVARARCGRAARSVRCGFIDRRHCRGDGSRFYGLAAA